MVGSSLRKETLVRPSRRDEEIQAAPSFYRASLIAIVFVVEAAGSRPDRSHSPDKEKRSGCGCRKFKITNRPKGQQTLRGVGCARARDLTPSLVLAALLLLLLKSELSYSRSIKAGRASKYRDYYGLSPNYHTKYECKLPHGVPSARIRAYVQTYTYVRICHSCRTMSLWGCLLAGLGDEPDRAAGRRQARPRGVDDPHGVSDALSLSRPSEKSQIKLVRLPLRRSGRDLIADTPLSIYPSRGEMR